MKYILVKPQGGLNDMLCQIENCCRYAERFNRIVLVETNYSNAIHFRDDLSKYFLSIQPRLIFDRRSFPEDLESFSVYPPVFKNDIFDIEFEFDKIKKVYVDSANRIPLSFNFEIDYEQKLLVHQNGGGGASSFHALKRMRMHDNIVDELINRLRLINNNYIGVHVRNTDYISDYKVILDALSRSQYLGPVLLCTDDPNILEIFKNNLKNNIISFTKFNLSGDSRLHFLTKNDDSYSRNTDAILDLILLSMSIKLLVAKLLPNNEAPNGGISGFSRLALMLSEDKRALKQIICRESTLLSKYINSW